MPDVKFIEEFPLYRKFQITFPTYLDDFEKVNINMYCQNCKAIRTFTMRNYYRDLIEGDIKDPIRYIFKKISIPLIIPLIYRCASCDKQYRIFLIKIYNDFKNIEKIGQDPPWNISLEKEMDEVLGDFAIYYKHGKICESQSYGIGAFAYYRRMIEGVIDHLLDLIFELITEDEKENYEEALNKTKLTKNTSEKIELVYDILPPILNPQEFNPLKTIHEILSEGLHGRSDDECLEDAQVLRETTVFLVETLLKSKKAKMEFTEKMRKLLKKKGKVEKPK